MALEMGRRTVLLTAGATITVTGCLGGEANSNQQYSDEDALVPPDDLLGEEWERVPDNEDKDNERAYESDEGYALVSVGLIDDNEETDLENAFDDLEDEVFVTGEEIDIGDEALYDEIEGFAAVAVRDRNAAGSILAARMAGLSWTPGRMTAIEGAEALVEYWRENA